LPVEPADATAEGETGDAGVGNDPQRGGQAVHLCSPVEIDQHEPRLRYGDLPLGTDLHAFRWREIDHETAFADRAPGDAVPATLDRERQAVLPGEVDAPANIVDLRRANDQRRVAV